MIGQSASRQVQFVTEQMIEKIENALIPRPFELKYSYRPVALDQTIREARHRQNGFLEELNLPLLP